MAGFEKGVINKCPFCRTQTGGVGVEAQLARIRKRVLANDPLAILHLGQSYRTGEYGLAKDSSKAVEQFERAARLGSKEAHFELARSFDETLYGH